MFLAVFIRANRKCPRVHCDQVFLMCIEITKDKMYVSTLTICFKSYYFLHALLPSLILDFAFSCVIADLNTH